MAKSLRSMAFTEKAWAAALKLTRINEDSQTDIVEMVDKDTATNDGREAEENQSHGFIPSMREGISYEDEIESLKAQVSQLEEENQVMEGKWRAVSTGDGA